MDWHSYANFLFAINSSIIEARSTCYLYQDVKDASMARINIDLHNEHHFNRMIFRLFSTIKLLEAASVKSKARGLCEEREKKTCRRRGMRKEKEL
ncbi:uncharacterized protein LOC106876232 isoform X2 [Octopus bimaculoides]|uniref:uncharacterized protein LOC106876232 isoform X2 n=1 Tax=Octopus bimaculoides TaxID=37653 RepID=UPI0022E91455|nr:uncharacterized protein LOC106876232 isoform X2 [Octopus bimaculoides]